jgi:hypothetical protein
MTRTPASMPDPEPFGPRRSALPSGQIVAAKTICGVQRSTGTSRTATSSTILDVLEFELGEPLADYPFYNGDMIHNDREGWVWYLQSSSQRETLPRIRARDGAVYPFRR